MKSVSAVYSPRSRAVRPAAAMSRGASLWPSTCAAIRVSTEPTISAVTSVPCPASWEAEWVSEHSEPLPPVLHTECGQEFSPVMRCRTCGEPAGIRDVHAEIRPSGGFQRSVPRVATRRRSAAGSAGPGLVPQTIELIGNRWSASALAAALFGARRFTDVLTMTGAPPTIVADRLHTFCQMGVLTTVTPPGAGRAEYRLTDKGRAFFPHVMMMLEWGDRWFRAPEGPATLLTHTACGREFHPVLHCSACGYELHGTRVQVGLG
jgi:DNA-binding HxlR family transcriptional regulator